ncbi:MAG TPA: hypothetical protein VLJ79_01125 [Candidatus Binatia bacterium]|nr:hypothetical protein [Candidatus Binatia bacterium]
MNGKAARTKRQTVRSQEKRPGQIETPIRSISKRPVYRWLSLIFLIHAIGLIFLFAPPTGLFNSQPVIEQDWGLHFHHLESMAAFWRQNRISWGYNPFFMAGYPSNTIQDLSIKFFEFAALGLATLGLAPIQWFKLLAFLATAAVPWFMYFAARNLFFDRDEIKSDAALMAALLGTAYWWNSLPREMFFYGMAGYAPASYTSVLGVSLLYRIAKTPSLWSPTHLGWLLLSLVILPLHVQSIVIFLPPLVALLVLRPQLFRRNLLIWTAGAAALSILTNLPWLAPAFAHRGDDVAATIVDQLPLFTSVDLFTFIKDYLGPTGYWTFRPSFAEKGFRLMLLFLGSWGTWKLLRDKNRAPGAVLASASLVLFVVAYFGSLISFVKGWQPMRFKVPLDLFLALGASYITAYGLVRRSLMSRVFIIPTVAACGLLAFLFNLFTTETRGTMLLRTEIRPELNVIVDWIKQETAAGGRVLFEESGDETGFVYDGMYLSSFIPHWTDRELIGGPINLYNDRHHFAEFHSGKLLKKEIHALTDDAIRNYFRLYNIGAVVAFHPDSIQRLQSVPGLVTLDRRVGPVHLMRVNQPLSWFLQGEGKVKASLNRLDLSELKGKEVVLKYHWAKGLSASPPARIVPVKIYDDPIPFIKIIEPPAALTLRITP